MVAGVTALVVMPCSATKSAAAGELPAVDRYDGPMWRTLRAAVREARQPVDVWFLSARFGFHPATLGIPDYDQVMTASRAAELLTLPTSNRHAFAAAVQAAGDVLFVGGRLYRDTMRRASVDAPGGFRFVDETTGLGIGYQRAELRAWLQRVAS